MQQVSLSRTLATGASYYAGVGGITPDGAVTQAQLNQTMVDAYNNALTDVQNATYYNTSMLLADQHATAMANLSTSVDNLVSATMVFATVSAVAEAAANADSVEQQLAVQTMVTNADMSITDADVSNYNAAVSNVEKYAQEAGAYLAASANTNITSSTDAWAANNGVKLTSYTSVTYDATTDLLFMSFISDNGYATSASYSGYLTGNFKTADDIYNTGIAYGPTN